MTGIIPTTAPGNQVLVHNLGIPPKHQKIQAQLVLEQCSPGNDPATYGLYNRKGAVVDQVTGYSGSYITPFNPVSRETRNIARFLYISISATYATYGTYLNVDSAALNRRKVSIALTVEG